MEFLREVYMPSESKIIVEKHEGGNLYISGIFCQADVRNRNGRIYTFNNLSNQVHELNEKIQAGASVYGELDHPSSININLDRVSHAITSLRMEGNNGIGKAMILPTPMGNIARSILESGFQLGVSTRGVGTPSNTGHISDFIMTTVDIVANPSAPEAFPNLVRESVMDAAYDTTKIQSLAEYAKEDPKAQQYLNKEIVKFFTEFFK